MKLNISRSDLLRSRIIEPNWYPVVIEKVDEHPSKAGDSTNWDIYMTVLSPTEVAGVPLIRTFSEKAPGFAVEFLAACGANIGDDGGEFDLHAAKGKKISVHVVNEMYNGNMKNKVDSFRPLS